MVSSCEDQWSDSPSSSCLRLPLSSRFHIVGVISASEMESAESLAWPVTPVVDVSHYCAADRIRNATHD